MKIASAKYKNDSRGLPSLVLTPADSELPVAVIPEEEAYRWNYRGWPGVFLGAAYQDILPAVTVGLNSFAGFSTDQDVIKLAKQFLTDVEAGEFSETDLDVQKILADEKTYDPNQARDELGRWAATGGGSESHPISSAVGAVEELYPPANSRGVDTLSRHRNSDGSFTAERTALHENILTSLEHGVQLSEDKTYVMMGGGPASGKSNLIKAGLVELPEHRVHIDSDAIKERLPEYTAMQKDGDLRAAGYVHDESSFIAKTAQQRGLQNGYDVVLDGTGNASLDSVAKKINAAREAGYKVHAEYATCSTETAVARNLERAKKTGRLPPEDMLRNTHASVSRILPQAIEKGLYDKVRLWDTEKLTDGKPTLVVSAEGANVTIHNQDLWDSFRAKGK